MVSSIRFSFICLSNKDPFDASLDLLCRLDPKYVGQNLGALCKLNPSLAGDLLASVDQPLGVKVCKKTSKKYLTCDYNRDGDSFRSPWSGEYEPAVQDGPVPSADLRKLEVLANDSFDIYGDLYYEGAISSVYLWDQDNGNFAGVALLKKEAADRSVWDSIHVFEVESQGRRSATYKVTSTVILDVKESSGLINLSGSLTRQTNKVLPVEDDASHIANIGTLVEDIESKLRNILNEVYFGKTRDIIGDLRSVQTLSEVNSERQLQSEVAKSFGT